MGLIYWCSKSYFFIIPKIREYSKNGQWEHPAYGTEQACLLATLSSAPQLSSCLLSICRAAATVAHPMVVAANFEAALLLSVTAAVTDATAVASGATLPMAKI
ncbi:unnamed protein product [Ceratitis capitata]|uniref:(Mediterranean fruit fly) hypothetical protein n=1 Tax=Ceratitis capitata TaxID=7213 RepID=A0A811V7D1_CERCA|nr:unnamed protein product [Ceratitis capitata]